MPPLYERFREMAPSLSVRDLHGRQHTAPTLPPPPDEASSSAVPVKNPAQRRFMLHRAGFAETPAPPAPKSPSSFKQTLPDHPRPGVTIEAVLPYRPGKEPLGAMPLLEPGMAKVIHEPPAADATEGFFSPPPSTSPLPRSTPSPHLDLRERPRPLAPEEHQSLPPPGPPPQATKLHDLLGQDPDNALKFFNLTKWPPPSHLLHIQRTPGNEHLTGSRPHLVLKWVKEIAAARPELLTHNSAVRYLLNTLKDTLRTHYTRRGEPVPEDAQLEQAAFQLIDHTLAEAGQTQAPGQEKGPVNSYAEPARERLAVQERTSATPKSGDPDAWNEPPSVLQPSEFSPQTVSENQPIAALLGRDRDFLDRWRRERNRVPTDDFMGVVRKPGFDHLAGNLDGIALEWLRQQWEENPGAFSLPTRQHDLWQILKDGLVKAKERQGVIVSSEWEQEKLAHGFLKEMRAAAEDRAKITGDVFMRALDAYHRNFPPHSEIPHDTSLLAAPQTSTFTPPGEEYGSGADDEPVESGIRDLAREIAAIFPLPETDVKRMDLFGEVADEKDSLLKHSDAYPAHKEIKERNEKVGNALLNAAEKYNQSMRGALASWANDDNVTPKQLGYQWATGTGPQRRKFDEHSVMGRSIVKASYMQKSIQEMLMKAYLSGKTERSAFTWSLNNMGLDEKYKWVATFAYPPYFIYNML